MSRAATVPMATMRAAEPFFQEPESGWEAIRGYCSAVEKWIVVSGSWMEKDPSGQLWDERGTRWRWVRETESRRARIPVRNQKLSHKCGWTVIRCPSGLKQFIFFYSSGAILCRRLKPAPEIHNAAGR